MCPSTHTSSTLTQATVCKILFDNYMRLAKWFSDRIYVVKIQMWRESNHEAISFSADTSVGIGSINTGRVSE
jgi:archaellum biogenesis ATPase FlaH